MSQACSSPLNESILPIEFNYDQRPPSLSPRIDIPTPCIGETTYPSEPEPALAAGSVAWPVQALRLDTTDRVANALAGLAPVERYIDERPPGTARADRALDRQELKAVGYMSRGAMSADFKDPVEALKSGISTFMEDIHWLMRILNDVARIHPFIAVLVLSFKAVYSMEKIKLENDKRIISLYVSMKDMISVLVQLRDIRDPTHVGPDGRTIEARMQSLVIQAAQDIKDCANACDTYLKKKLLVKVLKGPIWEGQLAEFFVRFQKCRSEFELALAIHTASVTDGIKSAVEAVDQKIAVLTVTVRDMFRDMKPREEQFIQAKIDERGGAKAVQEDDDVLRELLEFENSIEGARQKYAPRTAGCPHFSRDLPSFEQDTKLRPDMSERTTQHSALYIKDLKKDLREDWKSAVDRNMLIFERKFTVHQHQLRDNLTFMIQEQNNQIIRKLSAGPHDRIRDKEIKEIWRETGGKRNIEANLFAITIRDHFKEKSTSEMYAHRDSPSGLARVDDWTCEYMNAPYLQRLREIFDEDGSGYVTISAVNTFVDHLPYELGWNLQHWIAYWTIGWQVFATMYRDEIRLLFAKMFALRKHILPMNRAVVEQYLDKVWLPAVRITESLAPATGVPARVTARFEPYAQAQELKLKENLRGIGYDVDALETVHMVIGQEGAIEKHVVSLICLLLRHHLVLFHAATQRQLGQSEDIFVVAANSLDVVYKALSSRYLELVALFKHRGRYAEQMIRTFCCELFEYQYDPSLLWGSIHVQSELDDGRVQDVDSLTCRPDRTEYTPKGITSPYDTLSEPSTDADGAAAPHVRATLGEWNGFAYSADEYPMFLMTSFDAHASTSNDHDIEAHGSHYGSSYSMLGTCIAAGRRAVQVKFTIQYSQEFRTKYFLGYIQRDGTLTGTVGWSEDSTTHQYRFILKRTPAEIMCHRPSPLDFRANKPQALWKFACKAVLFQVRKQLWSWSYFAERRETRNKLIEFDIRNYTSYGRPLVMEERLEWTRRRGAITALDARFCREIRDYRLKVIPSHLSNTCVACGYQIRGTRVVCIDCQPINGDYTRTVDFCDDPRCLESVIQAGTQQAMHGPHLPSHDFFKVRTVVHVRDMYAVNWDVKEALQCAKRIIQCNGILDSDDSLSNTGQIPNASEELDILPASPSPGPDPKLCSPRLTRDTRIIPSRLSPICHVCGLSVHQPCWFCVVCFTHGQDVFLCDTCESKALLKCARCSKPYEQPRWYYGSQFGDKFLCNTCMVDHCSAPDLQVTRHTYLHALVRCKMQSEQSADAGANTITSGWSPPIETATSALGREVAMLRQQVQDQSVQLQNFETSFSRLERLMEEFLGRLLIDAEPGGVAPLCNR